MELGPILRAMQRNKLRFGLIAAQIAVTLAMIANCVTLILDARRKLSRPPVFDDENIVSIYLPAVDPALRDDERRDAWAQENLARLRGIPGVRSVTNTTFRPWDGARGWPIKVVGSSSETMSAFAAADENFPEAFGAEIDEGRWFTREEVDRATELSLALDAMKRELTSDGKMREPIVSEAVISRALGRHLFGEGPLLGKMLEDRDGDRYRIIGVLRRCVTVPFDVVFHEEYGVFYPRRFHSYKHRGAPFIARTEPGRAAEVQRRIEEWHDQSSTYTDRPAWLVSEIDGVVLAPQRMTATLMGLLVVLLLFVASLGVAGLTSFSVAERTRQIGTRRALGATTADIVRHFLTEAGLLTTIGLVVGAGLAVGLNMVLLKMYTDAKLSPAVVAGSALLLFVVGLGAALPPALRGARTSPAIATRNV
jgi:putative ABC transport system permease protein